MIAGELRESVQRMYVALHGWIPAKLGAKTASSLDGLHCIHHHADALSRSLDK